jgi:hypothetical protein
MKTIHATLAALAVAATFGLTSCKKDLGGANGDFNKSSKAPIDYSTLPQVHLSGVYTAKRVLSPDTLYKLDGVVYFSGANAKLYIKAGTHVVTGNAVTYAGRSLKGVLVIAKNAQIFADGNKNNVTESSYNPDSTIVFGPDPAVAVPVPGDFGGVILLGKAQTNQPTTTVIEGIPTSPPADVSFGGTTTNDNSGVLRFARIEYAGFLLSTDNEINGLTLGGVGSGTTLNHIQVSFSNDDSFEFFGGTVNADHLIALAGTDDDFDFDNGYSGTIQYALALKDPFSTHTVSGGVSDANGIESDNNAAGNGALTPLTNPKLRNFTILGYSTNTSASDLEKANHWRRASSLDIQNSILGGFNTGVQFEGITTAGSIFRNNVVQAYTTASTTTTTNPATYSLISTDVLASTAAANGFLKLTSTSAFYDESAYTPLNLRPLSTSPAFSGGNTTGGGTAYRGAIDPAATALTIWTNNWTDFTPSF